MGLKESFGHWELRIFIILSTILQMPFIIWIYLRKRSSSRPVETIAWLAAFLAADFVATLSLGGLFHVNMNPTTGSSHNVHSPPGNKFLLALWAPFILLHLGRHSRMTTFSLSDNEFWFSHLIKLMYHELIALFICILASSERRFLVTSIILTITGTLKFGERVLSLKRGSRNELRRSTFKKVDPGMSLRDIIHTAEEVNAAHRRGELQLVQDEFEIDIRDDDEEEEELVVASQNAQVRELCAAYKSFKRCKGLYVDNIFMYDIHGENEGQPVSTMDINAALNLIEMELNFSYEHFYTKSVFQHSFWGRVCRFCSLILILFALALFSQVDKNGFLRQDVHITYSLLIVSLTLELVGLLESMVTDYTVVQVGFKDGENWRFLEGIIRWLRNAIEELRRRRILPLPRHSMQLGQFNLLTSCFNDYKIKSWLRWILTISELKDLWDKHHNTSYVYFIQYHNLMNYIFYRIRLRVLEEQGYDALIRNPISQAVSDQMSQHDQILMANINNVEFERLVLVWHIATDLCHRTFVHCPLHLQHAKFLSDYMLYLLIVHPSMLSSSTTTELVSYRHACAETVQFYSDFRITRADDVQTHRCLGTMYGLVQRIQRDVWSRSLLLNGYDLALRLRNNGNENIWEVLLKLWVDLLSFAAINSEGKRHAEELGTGGQFLTHVWLYMVHLIMNSRYQI